MDDNPGGVKVLSEKTGSGDNFKMTDWIQN